MQVIFLQNVKKKGQKGEVRDINEGYARNFLIPNKLATEATPGALARLENLKEGRIAKEIKHSKEFQTAIEKLKDFTLIIKKKANTEGHLFSGVTLKEIIVELKEKGIHLEEKDLELFSPIKKVGETILPIVKAGGHNLKISIESE